MGDYRTSLKVYNLGGNNLGRVAGRSLSLCILGDSTRQTGYQQTGSQHKRFFYETTNQVIAPLAKRKGGSSWVHGLWC